MKKFLAICLTALMSIGTMTAIADNHANSGPLFYGQSIGFVASDAQQFLPRWISGVTLKLVKPRQTRLSYCRTSSTEITEARMV